MGGVRLDAFEPLQNFIVHAGILPRPRRKVETSGTNRITLALRCGRNL
jgi:hypothetical protein